jgi:hypothetical protein
MQMIQEQIIARNGYDSKKKKQMEEANIAATFVNMYSMITCL